MMYKGRNSGKLKVKDVLGPSPKVSNSYCRACGRIGCGTDCDCKPYIAFEKNQRDEGEWIVWGTMPEVAAENFCKMVDEEVVEYDYVENGQTVTVILESVNNLIFEVEVETWLEPTYSGAVSLSEEEGG